MDPNEYGDEIILHLASNLLEVEIILIPAFRESGCDPVRGITKIQPLLEPRNDPFYLFANSDSSILPPSIAIDDTEMLGEIEVTDVINHEVTEMLGNLEVTEENIGDIQIVVQDRYE